jgi:hypothetical protein
MFIQFFSCDSLIFIENYDQNSLNIKLCVIFIYKLNGYVWCIVFLCIQIIVFSFEIKLNKKLKYKLIIMHMFNICNFYFCVDQF